MSAPISSQPLTLEHILIAYNNNQFDDALRFINMLRTSIPGPEIAYLEVMSFLGLEAWQKAADAIARHRSLFATSPLGQAMAHHALGRLHLRQNNLNEALPLLAKAVIEMQGNQACLIDYGQCLFLLNRIPDAKTAFLRALAVGPCSPMLFRNIGVCALRQAQHAEAVAHLSAAWTMEPTGELATWIAGGYFELKKYAKSRNYFRQALRLVGPNTEILSGLGKCYEQQKSYRRALNFFKEALTHASDQHLQADIHRSIARCYERLYQMDMAQKHCRQATRLTPNVPPIWFHLVHCYQLDNKFDLAMKAVDEIDKIIPGHPDAIYARGFLQLLQGNWAEGWKNYESRWQASHLHERYARTPRGLNSKLWDGKSSLEGKVIMVFCEQGSGDYYHFVRYCRHLIELGATVDIAIPPHLAGLIRTAPWIRNVYTRFEDIPPHDYHVSLMTMPLYTNTLPETIPPAETPYLSPPTPRARYSDRLTVGISWAGDVDNPYDFLRSIPDTQLRILLEGAPEVQFVAIHAGPHSPVTQGYIEEGLWINGLPEQPDFSDVAAAIDACDLLVSVDTANAHIAGAMHKPVWILLGEYTEWRWLNGTLVEKWYPTMRHIRQEKSGNWHGVLENVATHLRKKAKTHHAEMKRQKNAS